MIGTSDVVDDIFESFCISSEREFFEEICCISECRILMYCKCLDPWASRLFSSMVDGFRYFPKSESVYLKARMRKYRKEELFILISIGSFEWREKLEDIDDENYEIIIKYRFIFGQIYSNSLFEKSFCKNFERFIFFGDDGDFIRIDSIFDFFWNIFDNPRNFFEFISEFFLPDFSSFTTDRFEFFYRSRENIAYIVQFWFNNCTTIDNYLFFGSIVLLEDDKTSITISIVKITNIFGIGSLEFVYRLIVISYCKYIWILGIDREDTTYKPHLCFIGILEFIYHDELILFCKTHADEVIRLDESYRFEDHIWKVYESSFFENLLICFENIWECLLFCYLSRFFELSDSSIVLLCPCISPRSEEFRRPISLILLPCLIETSRNERFKSFVVADIFLSFGQLSNYICKFFEECNLFFFVFFFLSEFIYRRPVLGYQGIDFLYCMLIELEKGSIILWSDTSFFEIIYGSLHFLDRITCSEPWLIGIVPRKFL